jgi:hypothetical protein
MPLRWLNSKYIQNMKLHQLIKAYEFDEIMPVINDMFPGTAKFRDPLNEAYDIMASLHPVSSSKSIRYKIIKGKGEEQYMGADDACFNGPWEVTLGKDVSREKGVDLNDIEILANCLVNMCFIGRYPQTFEKAHQALLRE